MTQYDYGNLTENKWGHQPPEPLWFLHLCQEFMGILLDTLAFFLGSCAQEMEEKGYLVYTHASCTAENRTVLCGLTLVMIFYLTFQTLVKLC